MGEAVQEQTKPRRHVGNTVRGFGMIFAFSGLAVLGAYVASEKIFDLIDQDNDGEFSWRELARILDLSTDAPTPAAAPTAPAAPTVPSPPNITPEEVEIPKPAFGPRAPDVPEPAAPAAAPVTPAETPKPAPVEKPGGYWAQFAPSTPGDIENNVASLAQHAKPTGCFTVIDGVRCEIWQSNDYPNLQHFVPVRG